MQTGRVNFPYKVFGLVGHHRKFLFHNEDDSRGFPEGFPGTVLLRYFMPMGDVGGKVAVAFGVLFVLLVVGVALKEVMD